MPYDYTELDKKISEVFGTRKNFAKALGLSERSMGLKMNKKRPWKQCEMERICELFHESKESIPKYFFTLIVQD